MIILEISKLFSNVCSYHSNTCSYHSNTCSYHSNTTLLLFRMSPIKPQEPRFHDNPQGFIRNTHKTILFPRVTHANQSA